MYQANHRNKYKESAWQCFNQIKDVVAQPIYGITDNHKSIKKNMVFAAIPGASFDPRTKIDEALGCGAAAVVYDNSDGWQSTNSNIKQLIGIENLDNKIGFLADFIYHKPSSHLRLLGTTGTNGKTSISWALANSINSLSEKAGIIGTLGWGFPPEIHPQKLTTPTACELQQKLHLSLIHI